MPQDGIEKYVNDLLNDIQQNIFQKAVSFREKNTFTVDSYAEMKEILNSTGGFISTYWDGTAKTEAKISEDTKATIRCIPLAGEPSEGKCIISGKSSKQKVLIAKGY